LVIVLNPFPTHALYGDHPSPAVNGSFGLLLRPVPEDCYRRKLFGGGVSDPLQRFFFFFFSGGVPSKLYKTFFPSKHFFSVLCPDFSSSSPFLFGTLATPLEYFFLHFFMGTSFVFFPCCHDFFFPRRGRLLRPSVLSIAKWTSATLLNPFNLSCLWTPLPTSTLQAPLIDRYSFFLFTRPSPPLTAL